MEKSIDRKKRLRTRLARHEIPKQLLYEQLEGKPVYFKNYKAVLNGVKTAEEIMGMSDIQTIINSCLSLFLTTHLDRQKYFVASGRVGLHLSARTNLSADIVVYDKAEIRQVLLTGKYLEIPPLAVIEIDIQAETADLGITQLDYYSIKTQKLLDFGVKEVIWFFSGIKKVLVAKAGQDWQMADWNKVIRLLVACEFSLATLLEEEGWNF